MHNVQDIDALKVIEQHNEMENVMIKHKTNMFMKAQREKSANHTEKLKL